MTTIGTTSYAAPNRIGRFARSVISGKLFLWMSGANKEALALAPSEQIVLGGLGAAVATTATLAALSMTYTAHSMLHLPLFGAVPCGLGWGLMIMNIDRWFVASIRWQRSKALTLLNAVPRLALALLIGLLISEPVILAIYKTEIVAQATQNRQAQHAKALGQLRIQYADIPKLRQQSDLLEKRLTTVGTSSTVAADPAYRAAAARLSGLEAKLAGAQQAALCELDGSCGSGKQGDGRVYQARKQLVHKLERDVTHTRARLATIERSLTGKAANARATRQAFDREALRRAQLALQQREPQFKRDARDLDVALHTPIGLLDRVEALHDLTSSRTSMRNSYLIWWLTILALDMLPVLTKTLFALGRPTLYDRVLHALERNTAKQVKTALKVDTNIAIHAETIREEKTKQANERLQDTLIAGYEKIAQETIDDLLATQQETIRQQIQTQVNAAQPSNQANQPHTP